MTRQRKFNREAQHAQAVALAEKAELQETNDVHEKGIFQYLRLVLHTVGFAQFVYAIYYYWTKVHWKPHAENEEELTAHWGGKFKFLTFNNLIVQSIYHILALVNDFFGSNALDPKPVPALRKFRDYIFALFAYPLSHNVTISFWVVYAYDRELILPRALDEIFPNWLNHVVHTNVAMLIILDLFSCYRKYPSRKVGIMGSAMSVILYVIWIHIVRYYSGLWAYPLLQVLNAPLRYVFLSALIIFNVVCYLLGEFLNEFIWAREHKLLKAKSRVA